MFQSSFLMLFCLFFCAQSNLFSFLPFFLFLFLVFVFLGYFFHISKCLFQDTVLCYNLVQFHHWIWGRSFIRLKTLTCFSDYYSSLGMRSAFSVCTHFITMYEKHSFLPVLPSAVQFCLWMILVIGGGGGIGMLCSFISVRSLIFSLLLSSFFPFNARPPGSIPQSLHILFSTKSYSSPRRTLCLTCKPLPSWCCAWPNPCLYSLFSHWTFYF